MTPLVKEKHVPYKIRVTIGIILTKLGTTIFLLPNFLHKNRMQLMRCSYLIYTFMKFFYNINSTRKFDFKTNWTNMPTINFF